MSQYLSALTTKACEGLLKNTGLALDSATFSNDYNNGLGGWIERYRNVPLIASYLGALDKHPTNSDLKTFAKNKLPAIVDAIHSDYEPSDFASYAGTVAETKINALLSGTERFSSQLIKHAKKIAGYDTIDGNTITGLETVIVGKFISHFQVAWTYVQTMNKMIESSVKNQEYLANTFDNFDNLCTGGIAILSSDLKATGAELAKLGSSFDFKYIEHLGTPQGLARVLINKQLWMYISEELAAQDLDPAAVKKDIVGLQEKQLPLSVQKKCYAAFKTVTGTKLSTIKQKLRVYNNDIQTLADLLDLTRLFPETYNKLRSVHSGSTVKEIYTGGSASAEYAGLGKEFYTIFSKDQADANFAFKKALQQVKCITETNPVELAKLMNDLETGFPTDELMSSATVEYFTETVGRGDGTHGTFYLTDLIGSPTHLPHHADRYWKIVTILEAGVGLSNIESVFAQLDNVSLTSGQITTLLSQADGHIDTYIANYPNDAETMNEGYETMALHVADELINMYDAGIDYDNTVALERTSVALFGQNLHSYATLTELYGPANVISQLADESTQAGRAIHAALKEGYNKAKIESYTLRPYMIPPDTQPLNPPQNSVDYRSE